MSWGREISGLLFLTGELSRHCSINKERAKEVLKFNQSYLWRFQTVNKKSISKAMSKVLAWEFMFRSEVSP